MDRIAPEHRSWNMSRIRRRDTAPEKRVRSLLHHLGFRFSLPPKGFAWQAGYCIARTAYGGFCAWLLLASAPGLWECFDAKNEAYLLGSEAQGQRGS